MAEHQQPLANVATNGATEESHGKKKKTASKKNGEKKSKKRKEDKATRNKESGKKTKGNDGKKNRSKSKEGGAKKSKKSGDAAAQEAAAVPAAAAVAPAAGGGATQEEPKKRRSKAQRDKRLKELYVFSEDAEEVFPKSDALFKPTHILNIGKNVLREKCAGKHKCQSGLGEGLSQFIAGFIDQRIQQGKVIMSKGGKGKGKNKQRKPRLQKKHLVDSWRIAQFENGDNEVYDEILEAMPKRKGNKGNNGNRPLFGRPRVAAAAPAPAPADAAAADF